MYIPSYTSRKTLIGHGNVPFYVDLLTTNFQHDLSGKHSHAITCPVPYILFVGINIAFFSLQPRCLQDYTFSSPLTLFATVNATTKLQWLAMSFPQFMNLVPKLQEQVARNCDAHDLLALGRQPHLNRRR